MRVDSLPSVQNRQKQSGKVRGVWNSKYSAMLSKIHFYRLLFPRFCSLGWCLPWELTLGFLTKI